MTLQYTPKDLLNRAKMQSASFLIVEGKDDVPVYNNVLQHFFIGKKVKIYPVSQLKDYGEGCEEVIRCIRELHQDGYFNHPEHLRFLLGIVDQDARPYKPLSQEQLQPSVLVGRGLLILRFYSIESYFAAPYLIKKLIARLTYVLEQDIEPQTIDFVQQAHDNDLHELYYISLEALQAACDPNYRATATVGYDRNDAIRHKSQRQALYTQILPKKEQLDAFAKTMGISINDIKTICKGKWYLYSYIYKACFQIRKLADLCRRRDPSIQQCESCAVQNEAAHCRFVAKRIEEDSLYDEMQQHPNAEEMFDILQAIANLNG